MDTTRLKRFATEARNTLMQGVANRLLSVGFNPDGTFVEEPQLFEGGATFMGTIVSEDFYNKWRSLQAAVSLHGIHAVAEEAAYTWFNRLMAIRILVKNGLVEPILQYESEGVPVPLLVTEARQGRLPNMSDYDKRKLDDLLADDSKTAEQFAILIVAFCHSNPIINRCFGHIADYTELLLPANILADGGFVDMLNNTEFISDDDYHSPELIGWLYQFYISEKKDEVFAKKGKFETDEIPAATQIFTPNWIVKYMVQNTVGRIYLDNNPTEQDMKRDWRYLVEPEQPTPDENIFHYSDLTELKVADLACGSGHILNECFDMLFKLYLTEGYSRSKAIESIFKHNLTGIDIDTRAKQLAQFALLLKACQQDRSFADAHLMPVVLDMPDPYPYKDSLAKTLPQFLIGANSKMTKEITDAITLMDQAQNLGSLMKFTISEATRNTIAQRMQEYDAQPPQTDEFEQLKIRMRIILALTQNYSALVMNPPYMNSGRMNPELSGYLEKNYNEGRADLYSAFMMLSIDRLADNGKYGMINMHSWMFLSSFESLRISLLNNYHIDNLLHLGPQTFDEINGEVVQNAAFVVTKKLFKKNEGTYFRLVTGKNCTEKEQLFVDALQNHAVKIYYSKISQKKFEKIPGCLIGYWLSEKMIEHFSNDSPLEKKADLRSGISTGDNDRFYRFWFECGVKKMSPNYKSTPFNSSYKWFKIIRGGTFKKWYGCCDNVINLENSCNEIKNSGLNHRLRTPEYYTKLGITWNRIASNQLGFRIKTKDFNFGENSPCMFMIDKKISIYYVLAILNSKCIGSILNSINPTLSNQLADLVKLPISEDTQNAKNVEDSVKQNISISKQDWDAHETSWDFEENPLVAIGRKAKGKAVRLADCVEQFEAEWSQRFLQLHANEEELNRQFIEIYGLQDELTPEVPFSEITILQQGEISVE